jgi:ferritin-like protein
MEHLHRRVALSRKSFLAFGASGVATAAAGALGPGMALAAPQPPAPEGDDLGFLAFGAVAEGASRAFYRQALATPGLFDANERRHLARARKEKRDHLIRLSAAMGPDAVGSNDFEVDLPKSSFATRDKALALGASLEELLVGVYLNGAGYAADPGTRLLVARLLIVDGQLLGQLRAMAGEPVGDGLPNPLSTEDAGAALDKLISVPGSPGER